jgi:cytoskeleton protein RodZ
MSERLILESATYGFQSPGAQMEASAKLSAGQMLKQARLNAGLSVVALANILKVPAKRLESLEDDGMASLSDAVFVRALALGICQTLRVDPSPILEKLPKASLPRLDNQSGLIHMPIRMKFASWIRNFVGFLKTPWMLGVLLLLLGAATMYLLPKPLQNTSFGTPAAVTFTSKSVDSSTHLEADLAKRAVPISTPENTFPGITAPELNKNETGKAANSYSSNDFALIAANTTVPKNSIVVFKAAGQTWIEVRSFNGITILKKLLNKGDVVGAAGTLPLTVIVGKVDVTQVEVRGKEIDLASIAKSNVARFEVN